MDGLPDGWRKVLADVIVYHHQTSGDGVWANPCRCGWGTRSEDLAKSHADHVIAVFERELWSPLPPWTCRDEEGRYYRIVHPDVVHVDPAAPLDQAPPLARCVQITDSAGNPQAPPPTMRPEN